MQGKWIFTTCLEHPNCTAAFEFVDVADEADIVPVPQRVRVAQGNSDFPDDVCVGEQHLPGEMSIKSVR